MIPNPHRKPHSNPDLKKVLEGVVGGGGQGLSLAAYGSGIGKIASAGILLLGFLYVGLSMVIEENFPDESKKIALEERVQELQEDLEEKIEDAQTLAREILALFPEEEVSKPA